MKYFILFLLFTLSACGFTPVHMDQGAGQYTTLPRIEIAVIPNRSGQTVRNHLMDSLYHAGYPTDPDLILHVSPIRENIVEIGIDRDDEASRAQLRLEADMILKDRDGQVKLRRTVRAVGGYNILAGQFTTFVTREDARRNALKALADNIRTQIEIYSHSKGE